ncbi:hypothetical protein [Pedobacter steynii]|uniref:Uncharacterized protein n=1 Tax=Pedobacter steynii TaxID=430522 RepID=A0A1D7QN06_9SPHI|nr:hypothetical protein [Pedobacter steynii]AOM80045.1 hypothetical protein BFS30_24505 [Pedobacter steynii]
MLKLKKVKSLTTKELESILGGAVNASLKGDTDSKDVASGLGSGQSNTDYDGTSPIIIHPGDPTLP